MSDFSMRNQAMSKLTTAEEAKWKSYLGSHFPQASTNRPQYIRDHGIGHLIIDDNFNFVCWLLRLPVFWVDLLEYACENHASNLVDTILVTEAEKIRQYSTFIHYALRSKNTSLIYRLLAKDARVDFKCLELALEAPRELAVKLLKELVERGAIGSYNHQLPPVVFDARKFSIAEIYEMLTITFQQSYSLVLKSNQEQILDMLLAAKTTDLYEKIWQLLIKGGFEWETFFSLGSRATHTVLIKDYLTIAPTRYPVDLIVELSSDEFQRYFPVTPWQQTQILRACINRDKAEHFCVVIERGIDWVVFLDELYRQGQLLYAEQMLRACQKKITVDMFMQSQSKAYDKSFAGFIIFRERHRYCNNGFMIDDTHEQFQEWLQSIKDYFTGCVTNISSLKTGDYVMYRSLDHRGILLKEIILRVKGITTGKMGHIGLHCSDGYKFSQPKASLMIDDWLKYVGISLAYEQRQPKKIVGADQQKYICLISLPKPLSLLNLCILKMRHFVLRKNATMLPLELQEKIYI